MSTDGMDQYLQATRPGALVQAIELAAKSDRLARREVRSRKRELDAGALQVCLVALCCLLVRPAWTIGVIVIVIALGLDFLSG